MKDKHDIAQVLEHYGRTVGTRYGWQPLRCVIHDDRHASASVNLDEGAYTCHACAFYGDVYDLIQRIENVEYKDAISRAETITNGNRTQVRSKPQQRDSLLPAQSGRNKRSGTNFFTRNRY